MKFLLIHAKDAVSWCNYSREINAHIQLLVLSLAGNKFNFGQIMTKSGNFENRPAYRSVLINTKFITSRQSNKNGLSISN